MPVAFSPEVEKVLHAGFARARAASHLQMTVEHLALELLKDASARRYLEDCGTDVATAAAVLEAKVASFRAAQIETVGTQASAEFSAVVKKSIANAEKAGRVDVLLRDVFLAILDDPQGVAAALILQQTADPAAFDHLRRERPAKPGRAK